MTNIRPLATGIGSLPHTDVAQAVDFVSSCFREDILFWPQLPKRSFFEQMLAQFSQGLPGLSIDTAGQKIGINTKSNNFSEALETCFQHYLDNDLNHFSINPDYAAGLYELLKRLKNNNLPQIKGIKGQTVGPITLGMSLLNEDNRPIIYHPELKEALVKTLAMRARWQAEILQAAVDKKTEDRKTEHKSTRAQEHTQNAERGTRNAERKTPVIISIDEPYLASLGSSFWTLKKEDVVGCLNEVAAQIHKAGALCAIHCCANTDWPLILAADLDILSFDAYGYLENLLLYEKDLSAFLQKGGLLACGIVPNSVEAKEENRELLVEKINELSRKHSLSGKQIIITPSCGCGTLDEELSERINRLCVEIAKDSELFSA